MSYDRISGVVTLADNNAKFGTLLKSNTSINLANSPNLSLCLGKTVLMFDC